MPLHILFTAAGLILYLLAMSRWVSRPCRQSMRMSSMVDLLRGFPVDTAGSYFVPFLTGLGAGFFLAVMLTSWQ